MNYEEKLKRVIEEARKDPIKWAEEMLGLKLYDYQKKMIRNYYSSNPIDIRRSWANQRIRQRAGTCKDMAILNYILLKEVGRMKCVGFGEVEVNGEAKKVIKVRDIAGNGVDAFVTKETEDYIYFTNYYRYKFDKNTNEITMDT